MKDNNNDGRYTICNVAKAVGYIVSLGIFHFKVYLERRKYLNYRMDATFTDKKPKRGRSSNR